MTTDHDATLSRRALLGGVTGLAVGALLAACGGAAATPQAPAAGGAAPSADATASYPPPLPAGTTVTISFANYNLASAGVGKEATEELINGFMAATPQVKVEGRALASNEVIAKVQADVVAGNPPDLVQGVFSDLDFLVYDLKASAVEDLVPPAEFAAYKGGEHPITPNGLKLGELGGKTYGVPYVFSTPTLFYNADLFTAAGLDPNKPPATWAEAKQVALQIKGRAGKDGIAVPFADWPYQSLVRSNGGRVLSEDRKTITFAEPPAVGTARMLQDLVGSGAHPKVTVNDATTAFSRGDLGMILYTSALQGSYLAASRGKWTLKTAKMPTFDSKPAVPINSGSGLFILSKDPLKQRAAWELTRFLTSERGYTIITSKIGYLPLRPSIVDDERYLKGWVAENPLVQPNLEQLRVLEPWVAFPGANYRQISELMGKAVEDVVYNGANPEATLKAAQDRAQGLIPRR